MNHDMSFASCDVHVPHACPVLLCTRRRVGGTLGKGTPTGYPRTDAGLYLVPTYVLPTSVFHNIYSKLPHSISRYGELTPSTSSGESEGYPAAITAA